MNRRTIREGRNPRRSEKLIPILGPSEVEEIILKAENPRDRALVILLYLSGRRIGELLGLKRRDFTILPNSDLEFTTFNEKTFRISPTGNYQFENVIDRGKGPELVYYQEIKPEIVMDSDSGRILGHYLLDYLNNLKLDDYLFPPRRRGKLFIHQPRAYQIIRGLDQRLWLHAMRHIRFTILARAYRDDPYSLHRRTFHTRFESTMEYIQSEDDRERMRRT